MIFHLFKESPRVASPTAIRGLSPLNKREKKNEKKVRIYRGLSAVIGQIPAIITPEELRTILGVKSYNALAQLPIPRCHLKKGSKKYVYLASDVLDYLRSQRDTTEIDLDLD